MTRRYQARYESSIDPFKEFERRDKDEQYRRMNAADKITLNVSSLFLTNPYGRKFIFAYMCFLHLLVWNNMYHLAWDQHRRGHGSVH